MAPQGVLFEPLRRADPERIGSYVLLGRLGAGAMGRVYLGRSAAGRLVAVKTIKVEFAEEDDFRARFSHEVAAARRVSGAFTAAVVAADPDADVPWLATAYVPAPSLDRLVRTCGPLPVPAIRWLAAGCAEALASIHDAGLIHRDLKPSNVLVSLDGPRVIDFGVARAAERTHLTSAHGSVGTPAYMAPEQARDTRQATTASDIFSLGSTLLFAASGHPPYRGQTAMDVLLRLATEPPDMSGLPGELADIMTACLERDPLRRLTSASLLGQLAPYLDTGAWHGLGPTPLPDPALRLIDRYQRSPLPSTETAGDLDDVTFGSLPSAPAPPEAAKGHLNGARPRRLALMIASLGAAAGLVTGGGFLGAWISHSGNTVAQGRSQGFAPPPMAPLPRAPLSGLTGASHGPPKIQINQPTGDGDTVFVVHGSGWVPGQRITLRLAGGRVSPDTPIADLAGTFNYAVNQSHEFFTGAMPPGTYTVVATSQSGARAEASFKIHP
ncbi:MAG: serine/threonine-protein kinase [Micromonosporaceae bacterium]